MKHRLDLFGVLVLSFAAGNSGGITRDVMIGAVPPAAISDWRYVAVSILAGLITFYWYRIINRLSSPVLVFDAAGLALFAVAGAGKALAFHAGPVAATLLGMLTGIGGGMVRDVLVREIPTVLRTELYAVAALIGAAVMVIGRMLHVPSSVAAVSRRSSLLWTAIYGHAARLAASGCAPAGMIVPGNANDSIKRTTNSGRPGMSATVLVFGNMFDGSSEELSGPAEILVESNRSARIGRSVNRSPGAQVIHLYKGRLL